MPSGQQNGKWRSPIARLSEKYQHDPATDCWIWTGFINSNGYGKFWYDGRIMQAHCASWLLIGRTIPVNMELDHLCRNRRCVNPGHLEPVTRRVNILRGDGPRILAKNNQKRRQPPLVLGPDPSKSIIGVCRTKYGTFQADHRVAGRKQYIGTFATVEAAKAAYDAAKARVGG